MKTTIRASLSKILFPMWLVLCVVFFISVPGRASYIHWSTLQDLFLLPMKLGRINGWVFIKDIIQSIAGIGVFILANLSTGFAILKLIKMEAGPGQSDSASTRPAILGTAFLVGHGVFSLVFMTLALLEWLKPVVTGLVLLLGVLSGLAPFRNTVLPWIKAWRGGNIVLDRKERTLFALGITIVLLTLFYSSARLSYDSVAVYFSDAKLTALNGKIQYFTNDSFVISIFQTAIQFSAIMQLFGDQAARLFSWSHGAIIILFGILIAEKAGLSKQARLYHFLLLVTSTAFIDLFGDGKVELAGFSPIMAAIYWMLVEAQKNTSQKSILFLVGFLLGLAMVARPYNVILAGGFSGLFYLQCTLLGSWKTETRPIKKRLFDSMVWIGLGALGVGVYHLFSNWLVLGNPFAMITNAAAVTSSKWQWSIAPRQLLLVRLLYPFAATYMNTPQSLGTISPLFIGVLPALLIKKVRERVILSRDLYTLSIISAIVLLTWVFLFFTVMEIRYAFFLWIILFMPLSEIMTRVIENGTGIIRQTSTAITFLLLGFIAFRAAFIFLDSYSPIDGQGNPQCSDSRFCEYLKSINKTASPGDRVLTLGAFRYYLRTDLFACSTKHDEYKVLQELTMQDSEAFWEEVYRQGYKYIAYENDYTTRHLQFEIVPSPDNTPDWIELEPIFGEPGDLQVAYKINISNPPIESESKCQKNSSGVWEVRSTTP